jgi:hypothetical protein
MYPYSCYAGFKAVLIFALSSSMVLAVYKCLPATIKYPYLPPKGIFMERLQSPPPGFWSHISIHYHTNSTKIPQVFWMSVKSLANWTVPAHTAKVRQLNPKWEMYVVDDALIRIFMDHFFAESGFLWAYNHIDPRLGGVRADY